MKTAITCLVAAFLILLALPLLQAQDKPKKEGQQKEEAALPPEMMLEAQKYFPMDKGNWWEYKIEVELPEDETETPEIPNQRMEIVKTTKTGCRIRVPDEMPKILFPADEIIVKDGFIIQSSKKERVKLKIVKLPPKKGDEWTSTVTNPMNRNEKVIVRHTVAAVETVETPAGKFSGAVPVVSRFVVPGPGPGGQAMRITITMWFAPGVGVVKQLLLTPMVNISASLVNFHVKDPLSKLIAAAVAASELIVTGSFKKPEEKQENEESEDVSKVHFVVEKLLKGKLEEKEIVISGEQSVKEGKWILFLGKREEQGYPVRSPVVPADEKTLKKLDGILHPPKPAPLARRLAASDFVIVGKAIVKEERGEFDYWVFEVEKTLKGDKSRTHIDVLDSEDLHFAVGKRYILLLKSGKHFGRKLCEVIGNKADEYSAEKLKEYEEPLNR